jgi:hypothetical protein
MSPWLIPVILAIQEAEIRRIVVRSQPRQVVHKTLSRKNPSQKRAGGGPELKPQYHQNNNNNNNNNNNIE